MSEKINLQNLGGRGRGSANHPLIGQVRNLLIAPDGYRLTICDSAQIEARVLAWLAGQDDLLQDFREGKSPYCSLATELFGEKVWKPTDEEKKTPEGKTMAIRYGFGKDGILGCGYGMGTLKFYTNCRENEKLRPLFDSGEYDWDFIDGLIKTYRKKYSKIPALWQSIEKAFRFVCKYPNEKRYYHNLYNPGYGGPLLSFWKSGATVNIRLPSGRVLYYHHAKVNRKGDISYDHGKLWGGSLVENIVQAISRDLLGYWILECEKSLPVILHCHDEVVCCSLASIAESDLEIITKKMSKGPAWAEGLPLAAEGQISRCYVK